MAERGFEGTTAGRDITVRCPETSDVFALAQVHVETWRETYRGLMPDVILDDPGLIAARERFWSAALTDERYAANRAALAESGGRVVGIAMSGPAADEAVATRQLFLLYVLAAHHGSGAGQQLLDAVVGPSDSVLLWVADPNPRAQAFYAKNGFRPDGTTKTEDSLREIRLIREALGQNAP